MSKAAIFALATLAICRAQSPPPGTLEGTVSSTTGEPLKNASVQLLGQMPPIRPPYTPQRPPERDSYTVSSDASGRFAFDSLPAGQYSFIAKRVGYFPYSGPPVTVDPGQPASLSIKLTPESRIEGKVTGDDGEPLPGSISLRGWFMPAGGAAASVAADGTFVASVGAGHLYVGIYPNGTQTPAGDLQGTWPREVYVPTYYPSSTAMASATMLNVPAGAVIRGIDIRVRKVTVYTVRGHAIDGSTGKPAAGLRLVLQADGGPSAITSISADGGFEFQDVQPATYAVSGFYSGRASEERMFALQPVVVAKENVEDVTVTLRPGATIAGKFAMEDGHPVPSAPNAAIALLGPSSSVGRMQPDGTFVIRGIAPVQFFLRANLLPPQTYAKSILLNRQPVSNNAWVDLSSGGGGAIDVVLSAHPAEISGTVLNAAGKPAPQVRVFVWKPGRTTGGSVVQPEGTALTNSSGAFRVTLLAPGEYRVAAWDGPPAAVPPVPEFLSQFDGLAAAVKLEEDTHASVDAPLIPQDAIDRAAENTKVQ